MKKGFALPLVIGLILAVFLLGLSYWYFSRKSNPPIKSSQNPIVSEKSQTPESISYKNKIAFVDYIEPPSGAMEGYTGSPLKIIDENGKNLIQIGTVTTTTPINESTFLTWSPNGKLISYPEFGGLFGFTDGKNANRIFDDVTAIASAWSPDSTKKVYIVYNSTDRLKTKYLLKIYNLQNQEVVKSVKVVDFPGDLPTSVIWTKANLIEYILPNKDDKEKLTMFDPLSDKFSEKVLAENGGNIVSDLLYSSSKGKIAYVLRSKADGDEVWTANSDGSNPKKVWAVGNLDTCGIEGGISNASPDLQFIVASLGCPKPLPFGFVGKKLDPADFLVDTVNGTSTDVTKNPPLTWSPDGMSFIAKNDTGLGIYDTKGQKVRQLLDSKTAVNPAWNPQ